MKRFFERLDQLDQLIRHKNTGSPGDLARRMHISERQTFTYLNVMRERGAPIKYDRMRKTYYYALDGKFVCDFIDVSPK